MPPSAGNAALRNLACSLLEADDPRAFHLAACIAEFLEFARGPGWSGAEVLRRRLAVKQLIQELNDPSNLAAHSPRDTALRASAIAVLTDLIKQCNKSTCPLW